MDENMKRFHPLPWRVESVEQKASRSCHHKSRTWIIVDANGRRVWWTENVVAAICDTMNAAMSAK